MTVGTPFMQTTLGASARLAVEVAWGADLSAAAGTWTWTEVTGDVMQAGNARIPITIGRGDEASATQPAKCSLQLDNRTGAYSLGGQSSNWPNVRRGTPIRVRVSLDAGVTWSNRFAGFADGWTPSWDVTGKYAIVKLAASGTLRRLGQGAAPVLSPMRRLLLAKPKLVAYWPCEDKKGARVITSGREGDPPMTISGDAEQPFPDFASSDDFIASTNLPEVKLTKWAGAVPDYTPTSSPVAWQVRWLMETPKVLNGTQTVVLSVYTKGTVDRWDVTYVNADAGDLYVQGYSGGVKVFEQGAQLAANSTLRRYAVTVVQNGAGVDIGLSAIGIGYTTDGGYVANLAAATNGAVTQVTVAPTNGVDDTIIGHISVEDLAVTLSNDYLEQTAFDGELVTDRITRLCAENEVPLTIVGTSTIRMGPQSIDTLVKLLRECEATDQGLLYDGVDFGLTYVCRSVRENAAAGITLDAAQGQLAREVAPVHDDARTRNKVTASRSHGGSATVQDVTGVLGTDAIGTYTDSVTVNPRTDNALGDYAQWHVHRGTLPGYRYPKVNIDLAHDPALAPSWVGSKLSDRIDVTNPSTVRAQHPAGTLRLLQEGYSETLGQFSWDIDVTTSSYEPWRIGMTTATTGDTDPENRRLSSDGAVLASTAAQGATSLSVATASGPLWTTVTDDYPLQLDVGGIIVTATACSGSSSPQTMTVTGVTKALPAGLTVDLYQAPALGI